LKVTPHRAYRGVLVPERCKTSCFREVLTDDEGDVVQRQKLRHEVGHSVEYFAVKEVAP